MTARVTIATIAAAAGVSQPTVSRVLNGRTDVSSQTRDRIERLLLEHDYRPRQSWQPLRVGVLDLVLYDLDSPGVVELIRGVEEVTHRAGFATVVSAVCRGGSPDGRWLQDLRSRASDGVVLVIPATETAAGAELQRLKVPIAVVDCNGAAAIEVPTIGATNWAGGRSATQHLISMGHRRIGLIESGCGMPGGRARRAGYQAALEEAGIEADRTLLECGDSGHRSGLAAGSRLLDRPDPPTAVFALSDQMALGVYEAARRRGLRVPDDLSVAGFGDLAEAGWAAPPLTTVRQPLAEMGGLAARTVLRLARGEQVETPRVELLTKLIVRHSTTRVVTAQRRDRA